MDLGQQEPFLAWFIKCFPLAFLVVWEASPTFPFQVHSFAPWRSISYASEEELPVSLRPLPPEAWPEAPTNSSVILYGTEAVVARGLTIPSSGLPSATAHVER
jgi:hypothetical protein